MKVLEFWDEFKLLSSEDKVQYPTTDKRAQMKSDCGKGCQGALKRRRGCADGRVEDSNLSTGASKRTASDWERHAECLQFFAAGLFSKGLSKKSHSKQLNITETTLLTLTVYSW